MKRQSEESSMLSQKLQKYQEANLAKYRLILIFKKISSGVVNGDLTIKKFKLVKVKYFLQLCILNNQNQNLDIKERKTIDQ